MVFTQNQIRDIQSIVEKAVKTIVNDKDFLSAIAAAVAKTVENNLKAAMDEFNTKIASYKQQLDAMELQNEELVRDNKALNSEMDDLRQYSRRNNLRIFGFEHGGDTDAALIEFFNEKIGVNVKEADIDRSHLIGKSATKHIIVKFTNYRTRRLILQNRKKLKGSKIVVTEDLTRTRLALLKMAQEKMGKMNAWTRDGTIWVQCGTRKCPVRDEVDLAQMVRGRNAGDIA